MNLVFVGGIHGVGKTTFCKSITNNTAYVHLTASKLIKEMKASLISGNTKAVKNIIGNQEILIQALKKYYFLTIDENLLLDGHFTLLSSAGNIEKINTETFAAISPKLILVLYDDPEKIASRRFEREHIKIATDEIDFHQTLELEHAEKVAKNLNIQVLKLMPSDASIIKCTALLKNFKFEIYNSKII